MKWLERLMFWRRQKYSAKDIVAIEEAQVEEPKTKSINHNPGVSRHPKTKHAHGRTTRVRKS